MQPVSKSGTVFSDFNGLVTNMGRIPSAGEMNSDAQVNLMSIAPSEITSRPGLRRVMFDEDADE